MGLTADSTGFSAIDSGLDIKRRSDSDRVIAIAGNPNVGKSTLFNALTGMNQHTGNWPGKTVAVAQGICTTKSENYILVDIPGTYSLMPHSVEEEVARGFICLGAPDAVVVVCDATCLEHSMNLVLQVTEICPRTIVCINLIDEARRKGIEIDVPLLSKRLGVPVCETVARSKNSLKALTDMLDSNIHRIIRPIPIRYSGVIENACAAVEPAIRQYFGKRIAPRFLALRLLEGDTQIAEQYADILGMNAIPQEITAAVEHGRDILAAADISIDKLHDIIVSSIITNARDICSGAVHYNNGDPNGTDRRIDKILTGKRFGYPIMILLLLIVFWITIVGANYPSQWLSQLLFAMGDGMSSLLNWLNTPEWLHSLIVDGAYKVLAWVVSVMLPPMAIFFPLFTLLEDSGYLPRIAYNLDRPFKKCGACGKQALTMAMGFGCNAAGVVGCRIIDSKRERLIAMLTNSLVPCNGRFPTMITLISLYFVGAVGGFGGSALSAVILTAVIMLGIFLTFAASKILSATILRGEPSSFTLELPPYRRPQFGKVIVRSIFDRTLFVLGRAAAVAAPAGILIWIMANISIDGTTLLTHCTSFLDPFARCIGLDGVILMAFILGAPANEIVVPIMIMAYTAQGSISELDPANMYLLFTENGWTWVTAACTILFSLVHWPCTTTLLTVRKEAGGAKWTIIAAVLPTLIGIAICFVFSNIARLFL